jgi:hypothetical protein
MLAFDNFIVEKTKTYEEAAEFLVHWINTLKNNPTVRYMFSDYCRTSPKIYLLY